MTGTTDFIKDDGGRMAAGFRGRTGDCVCRAVAIASGRPYKEVYQRLALGNQQQRRSKNDRGPRKKSAADGILTGRKWFMDYMTELGFVWTPTMTVGSGCKVHLRADELPAGRLVCRVSKHLVAMIDGVIHDNFNPDRGGTRCVYGYYKLEYPSTDC